MFGNRGGSWLRPKLMISSNSNQVTWNGQWLPKQIAQYHAAIHEHMLQVKILEAK